MLSFAIRLDFFKNLAILCLDFFKFTNYNCLDFLIIFFFPESFKSIVYQTGSKFKYTNIGDGNNFAAYKGIKTVPLYAVPFLSEVAVNIEKNP